MHRNDHNSQELNITLIMVIAVISFATVHEKCNLYSKNVLCHFIAICIVDVAGVTDVASAVYLQVWAELDKCLYSVHRKCNCIYKVVFASAAFTALVRFSRLGQSLSIVR